MNLSNRIFKRRNVVALGLLFYDILALMFSYFLALYIAFGCIWQNVPNECVEAFIHQIPFVFLGFLVTSFLFRLYGCVWRLVSYVELLNFSIAAFIPVAGYLLYHLSLGTPLPKRYFFIGGWIFLWLVISIRFSWRLVIFLVGKYKFLSLNKEPRKRAMLIGGGAAGQIILRDVISNSESKVDIVCIIDDDYNKKRCQLHGVPIVGNRNTILANVKKFHIDEILFAIPTCSTKEKRDILAICQETGCKIRVLPGVYSMVNGDVSFSSMRDVTIEELLGRDQIKVNTDEILHTLSRKTILVTGGGGSIGSELCRQIARHNPKHLIIFDIYENNAYDIEQELRHDEPNLNLTVLIGSVRDTKRVRSIFATYHPEIVFHAAAHKHVPLMENSPFEAIKNNVLGTYKTAYAAMLYGAERFVLISTDKAVNPTNIMGASKRLCEMVIQTLDKVSRTKEYNILPKFLASHCEYYDLESFGEISGRTEFVAVRFGNVLGSNGSVIPLFKKQIAKGGPLTVTHPDIIRYFMTIPEAVSLVLEAETFAKGGEIFVLDMGEPVKIVDLARNIIKLSGSDVKIEYTGLRPGEKLYEEKLMAEEGLRKAPNELIHIAKPLDTDIKLFLRDLEKLARAAYENQGNAFAQVAKMVPTFKHYE